MTPIILKSIAAAGAVAGLAFASGEDQLAGNAYSGGSASMLTEQDVTAHATQVFARSDRNGDNLINADEYSALAVVTTEIARLNGFVAIESGDTPKIIEIPMVQNAALTQSEHIRIAAVSRNTFYIFSGDDGLMDEAEFAAAQESRFRSADLNGNGRLGKRELSIFAQRQANLATGV